MPAPLSIAGQKFGRLTAIRHIGYRKAGSQKKRTWLFRCDCGAEVERTTMGVRAGDITSCGCRKVENGKAFADRMRLPRGESSFRAVVYNYARRAKHLGVAFEITHDQFRELTKARCYYCNERPRQLRRANKASNGRYEYNGLDRLDNAMGYVLGNVVPCCGTCNRAKGTMNNIQFLDWVRKVYGWSCES